MTLKQLRERRGLSQCEVAKRLGVHHHQLWEWEMGKHLPQAGRLQQLAEVLGVSADDLLAAMITKT